MVERFTGGAEHALQGSLRADGERRLAGAA